VCSYLRKDDFKLMHITVTRYDIHDSVQLFTTIPTGSVIPYKPHTHPPHRPVYEFLFSSNRPVIIYHKVLQQSTERRVIDIWFSTGRVHHMDYYGATLRLVCSGDNDVYEHAPALLDGQKSSIEFSYFLSVKVVTVGSFFSKVAFESNLCKELART